LENELKHNKDKNRHVMEDRGVAQQEEDEEAIYSAVLGSGAYTKGDHAP